MRLGILSLMVIAVVIIGVFSVILMAFYGEGFNNYNVTGFNDSDLKSYDKLTQTADTMKVVRNQSGIVYQNPKDPSADITGGIFRSGLSAAEKTYSSVGDINDMASDVVDVAGFGGSISYKILLSISIILIIIVFIAWGISAKLRFNS